VKSGTRLSTQFRVVTNRVSWTAIAVISITLIFAAWIVWPWLGAATASEKFAPEFTDETWINSEPLTLTQLRGRVVLVEFWTYG